MKEKRLKKRAAKIIGQKGRGSKQKAAEECEVTPQTISNWQKDPAFRELIAKESQRKLTKLEKEQDEVDEALVKSAKLEGREGTGDRKLFYQLIGKLVDRLKLEGEIDHTYVDFEKLSDEDLESARKKILERITANRRQSSTSES